MDSTIEVVADATVEARRFLARVKPRTIKTDKGRVVTTTEIAEGLIRRASVEHAVVKGKRPKTILCADCKRTVKVGRCGRVPVRCSGCLRSNMRDQKLAERPCSCGKGAGRSGRHKVGCTRSAYVGKVRERGRRNRRDLRCTCGKPDGERGPHKSGCARRSVTSRERCTCGKRPGQAGPHKLTCPRRSVRTR